MYQYTPPPEAYQCPECLSFQVAKDKYIEGDTWYCLRCHTRAPAWQFGIGVEMK